MLKRNSVFIVTVMLALTLQPQSAFPHSGGTNADGCHTDHRTGGYHCHTPKTPSAGSITYCHVINGQQRCGYSRNTCSDLASRYGGHCEQE